MVKDGAIGFEMCPICPVGLKQLLVTLLLCTSWCACLLFHRFLHKHPEDPNEVPGGFWTDTAPVSHSMAFVKP